MHTHTYRQGLYANLSIGEKLYYGRRRLTLHNIRIWDLHDENNGERGVGIWTNCGKDSTLCICIPEHTLSDFDGVSKRERLVHMAGMTSL